MCACGNELNQLLSMEGGRKAREIDGQSIARRVRGREKKGKKERTRK